MHYVAMVGDQERQIEVTEIAPDRYQLIMDGKRIEVDAREISSTTLSLLHDDQGYNIEYEKVAGTSSAYNMLVRGQVVSVEVLDLRTMRLRQAQASIGGPDGPAVIVAPMPGKIVAVLVKEDQQVEAGQGLIVVEAMKMENELRAPRAGTVKKLTAEVGAAVENGASLCIVE